MVQKQSGELQAAAEQAAAEKALLAAEAQAKAKTEAALNERR